MDIILTPAELLAVIGGELTLLLVVFWAILCRKELIAFEARVWAYIKIYARFFRRVIRALCCAAAACVLEKRGYAVIPANKK